MDQVQGPQKPAKTQSRKVNVDEVIEWQTRKALGSGPPGFSRDLGGLDQILKYWAVETTYDPEPKEIPGGAFSLIEAANRAHEENAGEDAISDTTREELLEKDEQLKADALREIRHRLLKAGKTQQEIDNKTADMSSLTEMAGYLHDVEHPELKLRARVKTFVFTNFRGTEKLTQAYLPPQISFLELNLQLQEFVTTRAELSDSTSTARGIQAEEIAEQIGYWSHHQ
ncbi:MAG: hypothetical protein Q9191_004594 [Dirinaria sp. TL-2023a]